MSPAIILGALVVVPIVLLLFFRINAAIVFLALCVGSVLDQFVSQDLSVITNAFAAHEPGMIADTSNIKLALIGIPAVLTMLFMFRTVRKGHSKLLANVLPAVGVGCLTASLVVPLLPDGLSAQIMNSSAWSQAQQYQGYIIALSATVCLITVWLQRPKHHVDKHEAKHSKH